MIRERIEVVVLKVLVMSMFAVMLAMISACTPESLPVNLDTGASEDTLSVVSTIFAPYDFAREIAGGYAEITMLIPPASESHSYEPTPQDIMKIQDCDIFIYVGGSSDTWAEGLLSSIDTSGVRIITLMDCVEVVEEDIVEGMEDRHENGGHHDDGESEYDEHVWTSPKNAKLIVSKISDALRELDPSNTEAYMANTAAYIEKLDELDAAFAEVRAAAVRDRLVFGDRFPFRYLADAYELEYSAAFPGCSAETEVSAKTLAFLIDKIKAENIPAVFHIELSNKKIANTLSEATGAKVLLLHSCHNISKDEFESGVSYLSLMRQNILALKEALT